MTTLLMRVCRHAAVGALLVVVGACELVERQRLGDAVEAELGIVVDGPTALLATETYGWAEEGGDRSLLRLHPRDCAAARRALGQPMAADTPSGYAGMFATIGIHPRVVVRRFTMNEHGDYRDVVLDPSSCVLYWEAHFE